MAEFLQFIFAGLTTGAVYALAALGFTIIYNASGVINFAQGDFLMLGAMISAAMTQAQVPLLAALPAAALLTMIVGGLIQRFAIRPAGNADVVSLIIITIGASLFIQGVVLIVMDRNQHSLPAFSGDHTLRVAGAFVQPQALWVWGVVTVLMIAVALFFRTTLNGKAMLAVALNRDAARLVGINVQKVLLISFCLSALLGGVAGIVAAPITTTNYEIGLMFGLKGFVAATLGGLGSGAGAVIGGLLVGLLEAFVAGYVSSAYKDVVPFVLIIFALLLMPQGLFGARLTERV
jgi:branched-subunit amino acid ABC-type transport system permease component